MRRIRALLVVLAALMMSLFAGGPAMAGGPTSVLLVVPGTGQTASLYTGSADYRTLEELVGASEAMDVPRTGAGADSGSSHEVGVPVNVTWLIHDVTVWRVDRLYLGAADGPWISTQSALGDADSIWDAPAVWHSTTRGKELEALLERLGVSPLVSPPAAASSAAPGVASEVAAAGPAELPAAENSDSAKPVVRQITAGIAGLATGIALALAGNASSLDVQNPTG